MKNSTENTGPDGAIGATGNSTKNTGPDGAIGATGKCAGLHKLRWWDGNRYHLDVVYIDKDDNKWIPIHKCDGRSDCECDEIIHG